MGRLTRAIATAWAVLDGLARFLLRAVTIVTMLAFLAIAAAFAVGLLKPPALPERLTLQIAIPGVLPDMSSLTSILAAVAGQPRPALFEVTDALYTAAADHRVRAVVAELGPGPFDLAQNQAIATALAAVRTAGKPTYVFADSFGELSPGYAAYHLACAFDEIWLQPVGQLAATGIALESSFYGGLLTTLGVKPEIGFRQEYKTVQHHLLFAGPTEPQAAMMTDLAHSLQRQTEQAIATGRGLAAERVHELLDGAPYDDEQALAQGLVDRLGYRDELLQQVTRAQGTPVPLTTYLRQTDRRYNQSGDDAASVGLVALSGSIERGAGTGTNLLQGSSQGASAIAQAIARLAQQERIKAIILRVDSPGGSPAAAETIHRAVQRARARGKPVIVSMASVAGSGAYWLAAGADRIVAEPATLTGSIGVAGGKLDVSQLLANLMVRTTQVEAAEHAGMWSMARGYAPDELAARDRLLDRTYERFVARVAAGRHLDREAAARIAKGRIWTGTEARELGLVDRLGGLEAAIEEARTLLSLDQATPINLVRANHAGSLPQLLKSMLGAAMEDLRTLLELALPALRIVA